MSSSHILSVLFAGTAGNDLPTGRTPRRAAFGLPKRIEWSHRLRPFVFACVGVLVALLSEVTSRGQNAPPNPPPETVFARLFPKYTGTNGYEDLVAAGDLIANSEVVRVAELGDPTLKQMRQALEDPNVERALGMMRAGLDKAIQSPRDPDKIDQETLYPEYAEFRRMARVLMMEEYVALADGRLSKAIDTMRDGLRLGYDIQSETMISGLVGIAIDAIAVRHISRHYDQMALRDCIQMAGIAQEWLRLPCPAEAVFTMEHRCLLNIIDGCRKDPARLGKLVNLLPSDDTSLSELDLTATDLSDYASTNSAEVGGMLDQAAALANSQFRVLIAEIPKPAWQRKPLPKFETHASMAHKLCGLLILTYGGAMEKFDLDRVKMHLLGTHAAIHRFRWEHNRLPGSLAELKIPALTMDPFSGNPLVYGVKGTSYELYSVGAAGGAVTGPITLPRQAR